jgi:TM2 domain-containing membrane protein YozV
MFCKNCAKELLLDETVCTQCNAPVGEGVNFCPNCAIAIAPDTKQCNRCGAVIQTPKNVVLKPVQTTSPVQHSKSRAVVGVLALVFGALGIHNYYIGNKNTANVQLILTILSFVSCGITGIVSAIWAFVDAIKIFSGDINYDAYGLPFKS